MMKNGKTEIGPGGWFISGGKGFKFEKVENGSAIIRDIKGKAFVYGLETFKRILNKVGYTLAEDENGQH